MRSDLLENRPTLPSPFGRMRWQQEHCTDNVVGYAVGIASARTERAAYMTGEGSELTNREDCAAVLPKQEAVALMRRLYESKDTFDRIAHQIAFLVPVSIDLPLTMCTFSGH